MSNSARRLQADWPVNLSYDNTRTEVDKFYSTVDGTIREQSSIFYNKRQVDIFLLAMAIGKKMNAREKLKGKSQSIRRDALTEKETWIMCSVALSDEPNLDVLADPSKVVHICEEYANGGIGTLIGLNRRVGHTDPYEERLEKAHDEIKQEDQHT